METNEASNGIIAWIEKYFLAIFWVIFGICCLTRLLWLGDKPLMHDESLFAYYAEFNVNRSFDYRYLPILHGPLMLYLQGLVFFIFGTTDYTMRLGCAILGIGGLGWIYALRPWFGKFGTLVASLLYVISPMLMYYQRFFRNDALFIFLTLWIVVSLFYYSRNYSFKWLASFIFAFTLLYCNKESSVFLTFTVITFALIVFIHDISSGRGLKPVIKWNTILSMPSFHVLGLGVFYTIIILQRFVIEGITYEPDVVAELGSDFPLSDVDSLSILFKGSNLPEGVDKGPFYSRTFWLVYYVALFFASYVFSFITVYLAKNKFGEKKILANTFESIADNIWWFIGLVALCLVTFTLIFTTFWQYPESPFSLYQRTLNYWMGQNAVHRIEGPFHFHFVNLLIYELPLVLFVIGYAVWNLVSLKEQKNNIIPFIFLAIFIFGLHFISFHRADSFTYFFTMILSLVMMCGVIVYMLPAMHRVVCLPLIILTFLWLFFYVKTSHWQAFEQQDIIASDGQIIAYNIWEYLYEKISVKNYWHIILIVVPTFAAMFCVWSCLGKDRRAEAFAFWWLLTTFGASSYAREKVPWVGIHNVLPMIFLVALTMNRLRFTKKKIIVIVSLCALFLTSIWTLRNAVHVSFIRSSDVREKLLYGHTTTDLSAHMDLIYQSREVSSIRINHPITESYPSNFDKPWYIFTNDPQQLKETKVYVGYDDMLWPLYWYLRDIDFVTVITPDQADQEQIPFMFLSPKQARDYPSLGTNYHIIRGRFRMHWTPTSLDEDVLFDIWKIGIPGYQRTPGSIEGDDLKASKEEWAKIVDYYIWREVPDDPEPRYSVVEYIFAVRKNHVATEIP